MREIKFRLWSESEKQFFFWDAMEKGPVWLNYKNTDSKTQIQQYTGLKDKNGVEIYEGDLLTYADNTTPEQIFEVKFLDERGTFVFRELYNPTFEGSDLPGWDDVILGQNAWDGWEIADVAKVIGNIFEGVDK